MYHHADTDACADIGRTGSQVAKASMERHVQKGFQFVVDRVDLLIGFFKLKTTAKNLKTKMVFFVDHDRHRLVLADGHATGALSVFVRTADKKPLDEKLSIQFAGFFQIDIQETGRQLRRQNRVAGLGFQRLALVAVAFGQKRKSGDVAGQANARGDDDVAHRSAAAEPFTGMGGKVFEVHAPSTADGSVSASLI